MKKINKFMLIGIICVITGLSVVNSLTGHGIRNNPFLNALVLGTSTGIYGTCPSWTSGPGTGTSVPTGWTRHTENAVHRINGVIVSEEELTWCEIGGPFSSCSQGCRWRDKDDDGEWNNWMRC